MKMSNRASFLLRLTVSLFLLAILLMAVDFSRLREVLSAVRWNWIAAAVVVLISGRFLAVVRWRYILRANGVGVPLGELVRISVMSAPLGQLLPSGVGADLARGYMVTKSSGRLREVATSIVADRLIGAYSLIVLATVSALASKLIGKPFDLFLAVIAAHVGIVAAFCVLLYARRWLVGWRSDRWAGQLAGFIVAATELRTFKKLFWPMLGLSLSVQSTRCLSYWCIFHALGAAVSLIYFFIFIPLVLLFVMLPISVGGLGVREGLLIYFFGPLGVPAAVSGIAGLCSHLLFILLTIPGAFMYLVRRRTPPPLPAGTPLEAGGVER